MPCAATPPSSVSLPPRASRRWTRCWTSWLPKRQSPRRRGRCSPGWQSTSPRWMTRSRPSTRIWHRCTPTTRSASAWPRSPALAPSPRLRRRGYVAAVTLSLTVSAGHFESGRHFAAWLGLTPKEHSTGGKPRLGKISKAGHERLRSLLVVGATAVIRHVRPDRPAAWAWLVKLLERKPRKLTAVALANKMARIVWAMMARGEDYRLPATA